MPAIQMDKGQQQRFRQGSRKRFVQVTCSNVMY